VLFHRTPFGHCPLGLLFAAGGAARGRWPLSGVALLLKILANPIIGWIGETGRGDRASRLADRIVPMHAGAIALRLERNGEGPERAAAVFLVEGGGQARRLFRRDWRDR